MVLAKYDTTYLEYSVPTSVVSIGGSFGSWSQSDFICRFETNIAHLIFALWPTCCYYW